MRTVTLLLTAGLKHADGQGSHSLGSGPHAAPSAAAGDVGLSLSRLQVPEAQVFIGHLAHVQSAHRETKGTVSRALMSRGRGAWFGAQGCGLQVPEPGWPAFRCWPGYFLTSLSLSSLVCTLVNNSNTFSTEMVL